MAGQGAPVSAGGHGTRRPVAQPKSKSACARGEPCDGCADANHLCGPGCECDCHLDDTNLVPYEEYVRNLGLTVPPGSSAAPRGRSR
jgi:hypothetical protein